MNKLPLVTIAMHIGIEKNVLLLENLIKSFLICNKYENIELMLIESGGSKEIRAWLDKLSFNDYFENFDGTCTTIKKYPQSKIEKKLLFLDYPSDLQWYTCYMNSLDRAVHTATGEYFVFMAEDNQFVIRGDVIGDYVALLEGLGKEKYMVNFSAMQCYKYFKQNNKFLDCTNQNGIKYFNVLNTKWDPTYFCNISIYTQLGPFALSNESDPHGTINYFINRAKKLEMSRSYKAVPAGIWFHNEHRSSYIETIKKNTFDNPDFILFDIEDKGMIESSLGSSPPRPMGTDDWLHKINGGG